MAEAVMERKVINGRSYKLYTYNGETHNRTEWAKKFGVNVNTISKWINEGMSFSKIMEMPRKLHGTYIPSTEEIPFGKLTDEEVRRNLKANCMAHDCKYLFAPGERHRKEDVKVKEGIRVCHYMLWNNRRRNCDPRECTYWRDK